MPVSGTLDSAATEEPQPDLSVDAPDAVRLGDSFTITATGDNWGGPGGNYSTLSLSFPTYETNETITSVSTDLDYSTTVEQGGTLYGKSGEQLTAEYLLVEAGTLPGSLWQQWAEHQLSVTVSPDQIGTHRFYVRQTLSDTDSAATYTDPESSSTTDQQGFPVHTYSVEVKPNVDVSLQTESGTYNPGEVVDNDVTVTNEEAVPIEVYVDASAQNPDGNWDVGEGKTVRLEPGETRELDLDWEVHSDAQSGEYDTGVAVYKSAAKSVRYGGATNRDGFRVRQRHQLTVTGSENGNVEITPPGTTDSGAVERTYQDGTEVTVTANPESGFEFSHWTGDYPGGHRGDRTLSLSLTEDVTLTPHFESKRGSVTATVIENGSPVSGATVYLFTDEGRSATTGSDGSVTFTDVPAGTYGMAYHVDGQHRGGATVTVGSGSTSVDLHRVAPAVSDVSATDASRDGSIDLGDAVTVSPTVYNGESAGHPVRTRISVRGPNGDVVENPHGTALDGVLRGPKTIGADATGAFGVDVLPTTAGTYEVKVVTETSYGESWVETDETDWRTAFSVSPVTVSGQVTTDGTGEPVSDATITLDGEQVATTGGDGTYALQVDSLGTHTIGVSATGFESTTRTVDLAGGSRTVDLSLTGKPVDVYFEVSNASTMDGYEVSGEPVVGATLSVGGTEYSTDADGQVHVSLKPGTYEYEVRADGYEAADGRISVRPSEDTSKIVPVPLSPSNTGTVEVNVVNEAGDPLGANTYEVLVDGEQADPNAAGELQLSAGSHTIRIEPTEFGESEGLIPVEKSVTVTTGERTTETFRPVPIHDATITEFEPTTGTVKPGTAITATATIRNTGNVENTFFVGYDAIGPDGTHYNSDGTTGTSVTLTPGETTQVDLSWDSTDAPTGTYDLVAKVWNESDRDALATQLDSVTNRDVVTLEPEKKPPKDDTPAISWDPAPPQNVTAGESFSTTVSGYADGSGKVCLYAYPGRGFTASAPSETRCRDVKKGYFEITYSLASPSKLTDTGKQNFAIARNNRMRLTAKVRTVSGIADVDRQYTSDHYLQVVREPVTPSTFPFKETTTVWLPTVRSDKNEYDWMQVRVNRTRLPGLNRYRVNLTVDNVGKNPENEALVADIFEELDGHPNSQVLALHNESSSNVTRIRSTVNGQTKIAEYYSELQDLKAPIDVAANIATGGLKYAAKQLIKGFAQDIAIDYVEDKTKLGHDSSWNIPVEWQRGTGDDSIKVVRADFSTSGKESSSLFERKVSDISQYSMVFDVNVTDADGSKLVLTPDMRGNFIHQDPQSHQYRYVAEYRRQITVPLPNVSAATIERVDGFSGGRTTGETVSGSVRVTNDAEVERTYFVGFSVIGPNGRSYDNRDSTGKRVTFAPGETKTVDLSWAVREAATDGSYNATIAVWNETDRDSLETKLDSVTVTDAFTIERTSDQAANFTVSELTVPDMVPRGDPVTVSATIMNAGADSGTQTLTMSLGERRNYTEEVTLNAGATTTVRLTAQPKPGEYQATIATANDTATATVQVTDRTNDGPLEGMSPPGETSPDGLADHVRVDAEFADEIDVKRVQDTAQNYSVTVTGPETTEDVTVFLSRERVHSERDIDNVSLWIDGQRAAYEVIETPESNQGPWLSVTLEDFAARTLSFLTHSEDRSGDGGEKGDDEHGNERGDGSTPEILTVDGAADDDSEYATIQSAIDAAEAGDTIRVAPGRYREQLVLAKNVTLQANGSVVLDGSTFESGPGYGATPAAIRIPAGSDAAPVVDGFEITGYRGGAGIDASETSGDWVVRDTVIRGHQWFGVYTYGTTGDWTLRNVTVTGSHFGVDAEGAIGDWTILRSTLRENTWSQGYGPGIGIRAVGTSGNWTVRNGTIANNSKGVYAHGRGTIRIRYNRIVGNVGAGIEVADSSAPVTATRNWWGTPTADASDCLGPVTCTNPLSTPPGSDDDNGPTAPVPSNGPPTAVLGENRTVTPGEKVTLNASGSTDPDGDNLSIDWVQTSGPPLSLSERGPRAGFEAPQVTGRSVVTVAATVSDGDATDTATVTITIAPATSDNGTTDKRPVSITLSAPAQSTLVTDGVVTQVPTVRFNRTVSFRHGDRYRLVVRDTDAGGRIVVTPPVNRSGDRLVLNVPEPTGATDGTKAFWFFPVPASGDGGPVDARVAVDGPVTNAGVANLSVALIDAEDGRVVDVTRPRPHVIGYDGGLRQNGTSGTVRVAINRSVLPPETELTATVYDANASVPSAAPRSVSFGLSYDEATERFVGTFDATGLETAVAEVRVTGTLPEPYGTGFERTLKETLSLTDERTPPTNAPPTASLTANASVPVDAPVTLNASGSSDPDGSGLAYDWRIVDAPDAVDLALPSGATGAVTLPEPGRYVFGVNVSDGEASDSALVTVRASPNASAGDASIVDYAVARNAIEVGSPLPVVATVYNPADGDVTAPVRVTVNGSIVASRTVTVPATATRNVTLTHTFDTPGTALVGVPGHDGRLVNVTAKSVAVTANGSRVTISVDDVGPNDTMDVVVPRSVNHSQRVPQIEHVSINFTEPVTNGSVSLSTNVSRPASLPVPDQPAEAVTYMRVNHTMPNDRIGSASFTITLPATRFEGAADPSDVVIYRYHDGEWGTVETNVRSTTESEYTFRATTPGFSIFAVGIATDTVSTPSVDLDFDDEPPEIERFTLNNTAENRIHVTVEASEALGAGHVLLETAAGDRLAENRLVATAGEHVYDTTFTVPAERTEFRVELADAEDENANEVERPARFNTTITLNQSGGTQTPAGTTTPTTETPTTETPANQSADTPTSTGTETPTMSTPMSDRPADRSTDTVATPAGTRAADDIVTSGTPNRVGTTAADGAGFGPLVGILAIAVVGLLALVRKRS